MRGDTAVNLVMEAALFVYFVLIPGNLHAVHPEV